MRVIHVALIPLSDDRAAEAAEVTVVNLEEMLGAVDAIEMHPNGDGVGDGIEAIVTTPDGVEMEAAMDLATTMTNGMNEAVVVEGAVAVIVRISTNEMADPESAHCPTSS